MTSEPTGAVRIVTDPDPERFLATDRLVWAAEPTSSTTEQALAGIAPQRRLAAEIDDLDDPHHYAGIYGSLPMVLSVPGATADDVCRVPVSGLTWVGVHPDARRRGVLTAMVRDHLERTLAEGGAVCALHCSEPEIYGRFGYGMALTAHAVTVSRGATFEGGTIGPAADALTTRLVQFAADGVPARLRAVDEDTAARQVGIAVLEPAFYAWVAEEPPEHRRGREARQVIFARRDGQDVGAAVLHRVSKWVHGRPDGTVDVDYLVGEPAARLALLRRLVNLDLISAVRLRGLGGDDPVWHWIGGPRGGTDVTFSDNLWVRLVDLPAALCARRYAADCDVVLEVRDDLLPANAGRWRLTIRGGVATAGRADAEPAVRLDVAALGAAWLGSAGNLVAMHRAGRVTEHRAGGVVELWRALRTEVAATPTGGF